MWAAEFLAGACVAQLRTSNPAVAFTSVSIDTRTLQPGALYVALRGANFDGHRFVDQAIAQGATGVLVADPVSAPDNVAVLQVRDTLLALQMMGQAARRQFAGPVVAITGSNGKTTTRQLTASVLRAHFGDDAVLCTEGNYNNHIGVPLTLLRLRQQHRVAVIEMGMNHFDELTLLTSLAAPDIAVITNAGPAHLEGVGSLAGVAQAKGEIFTGMRSDGIAVLNADDHFIPYWEVLNRNRRVVRFGTCDSADVSGTYLAAESRLNIARGLDEAVTVKLPFAGEHNGRNALAAVAVAQSLGISAAAVQRGLESATNIGGRLTRRPISSQLCVIDDSYNANPASIRAGLQVLLNEPGKRILVLGDIAELGQHSDSLHLSLLQDIERTSVDRVLTLGSRMQRAATAIGGRTSAYLDLDAMMQALADEIASAEPGSVTVLAKGAHSMAMHRVVERLNAMYGEKQ